MRKLLLGQALNTTLRILIANGERLGSYPPSLDDILTIR